MPWTYFTSYLDGTRPITLNERDELYTQLLAKLATCSDRYSLNETHLAAITTSRLRTDLATLEDGVLATSTTDRLEELISDASAIFGNYASARAAALSGESITSGELADIMASTLDDHRLWNYYQRLIDGLSCECPAPTLSCRVAGASKTKCGWPEFAGYESTPPKVYLSKTQSGLLWYANDEEEYRENEWTGAKTFARPACDFTDDRQVTSFDTFFDPDCTVTESQNIDDLIGADFKGQFIQYTVSCGALTVADPAATVSSTSATNITFTHTGTGFGGSASVDLSGEYTTLLLSGDVDTALAAASFGSWGGDCEAFHEMDEDELTITKQKLEYKFAIPALGGWSCYEITWIERFTPAGGGEPTDTPRSYSWDGEAEETGVYSVAAPATPGTVEIVGIEVVCGCE